MTDQRVRTDNPANGVARLTLTRADKANAQDKAMLYQLDDALTAAAQNDDVRCIVLAAEGEHFSSGHDLRDDSSLADFEPRSQWSGFDASGQEGQMAAEHEIYLGLCWRWRNLPKPVVVQVQGLCMAGGLMLVWPFDIVIASEDAVFSDPTVAFGVNGVEYFAHVWELGHRKARELLYTGADLSAEDARTLGMVNHVVPRDELDSFTLTMAERIAKRPMIGLRLAKLACNQSLDAQGYGTAIHGVMGWQQVGHAQARLVHGLPVDPAGAEIIRSDRKR
ncbi:enoyl-CoA hydratase [Erythrobacter litoralis]|uniref:Putative enoyl-CoA hydratase/isomerase superfamily protein n=1 Tax=Erythrobacter litoralis (strain HTCC2594) TaxID=314225 RepID=Q2NC05_ERYLH|nr:enoyl-CoA hydratase [Erythrobacter litoralis]ABC62786.1 putative enoyl-CoA hydratase/isomerase superfamily protein [Erythrobacter litoralis HTCC2594]